jgi:hypothetical protein
MALKADIFGRCTGNVPVTISSGLILSQEIHEIQQVDVSMHLGGYPGLLSPWVGHAIEVPQTFQALSERKVTLFVFRARTHKEFHERLDLLLSKEWTLEELQPEFLETPFRVEIVTNIELLRFFHPLQVLPR